MALSFELEGELMSEYDYGVLLADAYRLAAELHRNQEDKSGAPYIQHVVSVAVAVRQYGLIYEIVGLLHDAIEDTPLTKEEAERLFGRDVADALVAMTRQDDEDYFEVYLPRLMQNEIALRVKHADSSNNLSKNGTLAKTDPEKAAKLRTKYRRVLALLAAKREQLN